MPQVFISYSRKDLEFVERLASDMQTAGLSVWYDLSGLEGGTQWGTEIQKAIQQSQYFLLVLSPNSLQSKWVQREFLYAENKGLKVVPLLYLPCELPMWLFDLHTIDLQGGNYDPNFWRVLKAMGLQEQADLWQGRVAAETKALLEAQEKERIAREEKQRQRDAEEQRRIQAEKDELSAREKARVESKAKGQRVNEEQRKDQQKANNIELWKKWKPGVIRFGGIGILIVLATFIGIQYYSGGFGKSHQSAATPTLQLTQLKTSLPSQSSTLQPSPTPEPSSVPLLTSTVESSFITSINDYISQTNPTFEDDFSTQNPGWGYNSDGSNISDMVVDGKLNYAGGPFPANGLFNASDFILQYDVKFDYPDMYLQGITFHKSSPPGEFSPYYDYLIQWRTSGNTGWSLLYYDKPLSGESLGYSDIGNLKGFITLKFISRQNNFLVFLDDRLLTELEDLKTQVGSENMIYYEGEAAMILDNVKFWNLDGVDIAP